MSWSNRKHLKVVIWEILMYFYICFILSPSLCFSWCHFCLCLLSSLLSSCPIETSEIDHAALDKYIHQAANAAYISYDLPDSRWVRGVEDLSHQHWLDRVPHDPGGRVGFQFFHHVVAERTWGDGQCVINTFYWKEYGQWINCICVYPHILTIFWKIALTEKC